MILKTLSAPACLRDLGFQVKPVFFFNFFRGKNNKQYLLIAVLTCTCMLQLLDSFLFAWFQVFCWCVTEWGSVEALVVVLPGR